MTVHRKQAILTTGQPMSPGALESHTNYGSGAPASPKTPLHVCLYVSHILPVDGDCNMNLDRFPVRERMALPAAFPERHT